MRRSLVLSTTAFRPLIPLAQAAEAAGFVRVWTTESTTRDALIRAVTLGLHTKTIGVATGIAYAFSRVPLAMAAAAADAHIATGGRLTLGLGAGTRGMRSRRYGVNDFDHPGSRLGDYVGLMRAFWAAENGLSYDGRFYPTHISGHMRSSELEGLPPIEVAGSGVNEAMLRLSAQYCDAVALHPLVSYLDYMDRVARPAIRAARCATGVQPWVAAWRITSISDDAKLARRRARTNLAFYFTTPSYQVITSGTQWEEYTTAVRDQFRANPGLSFEELSDLIPDPMIDDFCLAGTAAQVRSRMMELEHDLGSRGVSELVLQVAGVGLDSGTFVEAAGAVVAELRPDKT